eukprot:1325458-Prymnesium_polylepis.2
MCIRDSVCAHGTGRPWERTMRVFHDDEYVRLRGARGRAGARARAAPRDRPVAVGVNALKNRVHLSKAEPECRAQGRVLVAHKARAQLVSADLAVGVRVEQPEDRVDRGARVADRREVRAQLGVGDCPVAVGVDLREEGVAFGVKPGDVIVAELRRLLVAHLLHHQVERRRLVCRVLEAHQTLPKLVA